MALMRMPILLLATLLLLALPWNSCSRNKAHLTSKGQNQLRTGAGYFNPQVEKKSTPNRAFTE